MSTVAGTLADPDGLDVAELLALKAEHGDALVRRGRAPAAPREALFHTACDVLVPGARPDTITAELVPSLRSSVVAPGANIPYAEGACEGLHARGILALPDFVANAGGVFLYESAERGEDPATCLDAVADTVRRGAERVLTAAETGGVTPMEAALRLARAFLAAGAER